MRLPVAVKYTLIQLPAAALVAVLVYLGTRAGWLEPWLAITALAVWVAKDAALYPLTRTAFEGPAAVGASALAGRRAVVVSALNPRGQVRVDNERWRARSADGRELAVGCAARVVKAEGMVLVVERDSGAPCESG